MNRISTQRIYDLVFDPDNYEGRRIGEFKFSGFILHRRPVELYLRGFDLQCKSIHPESDGEWHDDPNPVWDKNCIYRIRTPTINEIKDLLKGDPVLSQLSRSELKAINTILHGQLQWLTDGTRQYGSITRPRSAGKVTFTRALYQVMKHYHLIDPNIEKYYLEWMKKYPSPA